MTLYRIRMSLRKWYVREFRDGHHIADHGPWEPNEHAQAEIWAQGQGWTDWDKS